MTLGMLGFWSLVAVLALALHATTYPARSFPPGSPATAKTGSAICPVTAALERSYRWADGVDVAELSRLAGTV